MSILLCLHKRGFGTFLPRPKHENAAVFRVVRMFAGLPELLTTFPSYPDAVSPVYLPPGLNPNILLCKYKRNPIKQDKRRHNYIINSIYPAVADKSQNVIYTLASAVIHQQNKILVFVARFARSSVTPTVQYKIKYSIKSSAAA